MSVYSGLDGVMVMYGACAFVAIIIIGLLIIKHGPRSKK